jgi:branched-chain amino acid transport system permease protein
VSSKRKKYSTITIIIAILISIPLMTQRSDVLTWFTLTFLYIILAHSWNILGGFTGQQNLGHAAFFGLGAMTVRYVWLSGVPLPLALLLGGLSATLFALIIGFPAFRLKGIYFVIGTLVMAEVLHIIFDILFPRASVLPAKLLGSYSMNSRYYLSLIVMGLMVAVIFWLSRSRCGMAMMSVREDAEAAEASGVDTQKYKLFAFALSTFFCGLAGGVYAYYSVAVLANSLFSPEWTFDALIIVFVGGVGTILGPIIGSVFFVLLKQLLSLYLPGGIHVTVFGVLFILVVLFLPGGLIQLMEIIRRRISLLMTA